MEQEPVKIAEEQAKKIGQMINSPTIPKLYANGFYGGKSSSDIFIVPTINGNPNIVLHLSFPTAKRLRDYLNNSILEIEKEIGEIKSLSQTKKSDV